MDLYCKNIHVTPCLFKIEKRQTRYQIMVDRFKNNSKKQTQLETMYVCQVTLLNTPRIMLQTTDHDELFSFSISHFKPISLRIQTYVKHKVRYLICLAEQRSAIFFLCDFLPKRILCITKISEKAIYYFQKKDCRILPINFI